MTKDAILKRLKTYCVSLCVSYTLVSLILSVLNMNSILIGNVWEANMQIFAVCFAIAVLMFITESIRNPEGQKTQITVWEIGLDLLDVALPVLGLGGFVFHWFNFFSLQVLYPVCIMLFVYFVIFIMFYINNKHTEKELNRIINKRKEGNKND